MSAAERPIVALFAALLAVENGYQAAVMAPTELPRRAARTHLSGLLATARPSPLLLTGSRPPQRERKAAAARLATPGTATRRWHARAGAGSDDFARLGLAVIDEQHRFGVEPAQGAGAKGDHPDVLLLSATPIPRSLALTVYGDLDVSVLDERPPGRQPGDDRLDGRNRRGPGCSTSLTGSSGRGARRYVVYPVIGESGTQRPQVGDERCSRNCRRGRPLAGRRVALLHGRYAGGRARCDHARVSRRRASTYW